MSYPQLFQSYFLGGFECSTHYPHHHRRLDLIAATRHDEFAAQDYARLQQQGITAARDGLRWHLLEPTPGEYNFSSLLPMLRAAKAAGVQVIWDLCHYGWPDDLDIFSPAFVSRFGALSHAVAKLFVAEGISQPFFSPINEISFFAWAAGEVGYIYPFVSGRGNELKQQLVRAAIAAMDAIWAVIPAARFIHADPIIYVAADPERPQDRAEAEAYTSSQFDAWEMLAGRRAAQLGGAERYLDIVGVNYYPHNQWVFNNLPFNPAYAMPRHHPLYRPFHQVLTDVYARLRKPLFIAETGADGDSRRAWLAYIGDEVRTAIAAGVPLGGLCLYPIVNFPWWDDDHHLHNALWDYADDVGNRPIYVPLAEEIARQQLAFAQLATLEGQ